MTREDIENSMTLKDAIEVFKCTNAYGTMDIAKSVILKALEQKSMRWNWIDDEFGSKCSCCGIYTYLDKFDRPMKFNYCAMCGARMI